MKLAIVNSYYPPDVGGGAESTVQRLAETLKARGVEVTVLALSDRYSRESVGGINVRRIPIRNTYLPLRRTEQTFTKFRKLHWHVADSWNGAMLDAFDREMMELAPDIVNFHNLAGWSSAVWAAPSIKDIPKLQVLHDLYGLCARSTMVREGSSCNQRCLDCIWLRRRHRALSMRIDAVVGVSSFILNAYLSAGYFSNARHKEVIYNCGAKPMAIPTVVEGAAENAIRFGYIGTLAPHKGVEMLLKAFMAANRSNATLTIAGNGDGDYIRRLKSAYADPRIRFIGYCDASTYYSMIDWLCVPSICREALGNVVYEAIGRGIPVIAARSGGIPEMIKDRCSGFLYDSDDLHGLIHLLRSTDRTALPWSADELADSVSTFFDSKRFGDQYLAICQELCT